MGVDIYSTMEEMSMECCTKCYGKMEGGSINCARVGRRSEQKKRLYFKSMLPSEQQISQLFPEQKLLGLPFKCVA